MNLQNKTWFVVGLFLLLAILLAAFEVYNNQKHLDRIQQISATLAEYNVPDFLVQECQDAPIGTLCTLDVEIKLPDKNITALYYARGKVLLYNESNKLVLYKLEPAPENPFVLEEMNIPDNIREALSKVTLVIGNRMFCEQYVATSVDGTVTRHYKCYIPTNVAPIGKTTIYYAPLFEIDDNNGEIVRVIVHV